MLKRKKVEPAAEEYTEEELKVRFRSYSILELTSYAFRRRAPR